MKRKEGTIYIVNQHYYPELASTGQVFQEIAEHLHKIGYVVTVLTGRPFYHSGEKVTAPKREVINGVKIKRLWNTTFPKSSILGKLLNLLTFQVSLFLNILLFVKKCDRVIAGTNPPLAISSVAFANLFNRLRTIFVIQDLYPDILISSGFLSASSFRYKLLKKIMKMSMKKAHTIITISEDMKSHIQREYGFVDIKIINNWAIGDIYPLDNKSLKKQRGLENKFVVQYSGNFGVAHEYNTLLSSITQLRHNSEILFHIVGGGINYTRLKEACTGEGVENVIFEEYVQKADLNGSLNMADISLIIFDDTFRNVLMPSKYYGILACGKPVVLISGKDNDIKRDIARYNIGFSVTTGEHQKLTETLLTLAGNHGLRQDLALNVRNLFELKYTKEHALNKYAEAVRLYD